MLSVELKTNLRQEKKIKQLHKLVSILKIGQKEVDAAIASNFKDFEDGLQNFCAKESNLRIIVTRNIKDFKERKLSILTPTEFLIQLM